MAAVGPTASFLVPLLADALVLFGVLVMTVGVYGVVRMPDTYTRLHAASKTVVLGMMPLLLASALAGDRGVVMRVILIGLFLLVTTPVSAHMVGRAAYLRGESMQAPEAVDEWDRATPEERR
jgi:multicomponent Na+:H+ antiporter subunit G